MTLTPQSHNETTLEASLEVPHPPEKVWALVSDLRNMARWSPQVVKTFVRGGTRLGATMLNVNHRGPLVWPTQAKVVEYDAPRKVAFRVKENYTIWSYTLEPTATGTKITSRREAPRGISQLSIKLTKVALGGQETFVGELREGMAQTLAKIAAELDRP